MTEDLEELLKTEASQVTDSLAKELNSKWSTAREAAQKAEEHASEITSLLTHVSHSKH